MFFSSHTHSKKFIYLALAGVLTLAAYSYYPSLKNGFVQWDDGPHLLENLSIRELNSEHLKEMFTSTINKIYIPLTSLSFAVEYHFFGYNPFIYHLDNLILHLLNIILVYFIALRLNLSILGTCVAVLIFGLHPTRVESVAWVTERKDVLYAFFYLGALASYLSYLGNSGQRPISRKNRALSPISKGYLFLAMVLGALSMLAKPMALSLPLILFLFDWFYGRKIKREVLIEKIPIFLTIAAIGWVTYSSHARLPWTSLGQAILIWAWTFTFYIKQFVFPFYSVMVYHLPKPIAASNPEYAFSLLFLMVVIISLISFRRYRWYMFAWAYYLLSIFFLLRYDYGFDMSIVTDRMMYLPGLGFCLLVGNAVPGNISQPKFHILSVKNMVTSGLVVLIAVFSYQTFKLCQVWKDTTSLWQHQLKFYPKEYFALNNLASILKEQEDYKQGKEIYKKIVKIRSEGMEVSLAPGVRFLVEKVNRVKGLYEGAIQANPQYPDAHYNLGNLYQDLGMIQEALNYYQKTLVLDPQYKDAYLNMGSIYREMGEPQKAIAAYNQLLAVDRKDQDSYINIILKYNETIKKYPENSIYARARNQVLGEYVEWIKQSPLKALSYFNLGFLYGEDGDWSRAISAYQIALDIDHNDAKTLYNLGNAFKNIGSWKEALEAYKKSLQFDPKNTEVYINLGVVYGRLGNWNDAQNYYHKAIEIDAHNAKAFFNLGYVSEVSKDWTHALEYYQKAIEFDSLNAEAYYNAGNVLARLKDKAKAIESYRKTVEVNPNHRDAWINLSLLSFSTKDYLNAAKYCNEAIMLGYQPPPAYLKALREYGGEIARKDLRL